MSDKLTKPVSPAQPEPETIERRVERLEEVLGTFIAWSSRELGTENARALLENLHKRSIP
jgi:hypothetical protein